MAETNRGLFTESFERAVSSFYDAVQDTCAGDSSRPVDTLADFPTSLDTDPATMQASVKAIVEEFRKTVHAPWPEDEKSTPNDEWKATTSFLEKPSQFTTVATIHAPPQTPSKPDDDVLVAFPKKPTVASTLESTAKKSLIHLPTLEDVHMDYTLQKTQPLVTLSNKVVIRTYNPSHIIDFEWSLEKFSNYIGDLYSNFYAGDGCEKSWQAKIALTTVSTTQIQYMEVYIILASTFKGIVNGFFDLGVYNTKGEAFGKWATLGDFTESSREHQCFKILRPAGSKSSDEIKLHDEELIIKGRIAFTGCCVSTRTIQEPMLNIDTACKIAEAI